MPIFDQFETEPYVTYSGSYTDEYFYGSIFNSSPALSREIIALKTTGIVVSSFLKKDISRVYSLQHVFGEYIGSKTKNSNVKHFDVAELIYDTIPTNPIAITKANNVITPYLETTSSWKQIFSASLEGSSNLGRQLLTENSVHIFLAGQNEPVPSGPGDTLSVPNINNFTDNVWLSSFPFQSKYKNLKRILGTGLDVTTIDVDIYSGSFLSPPIQTQELGSLFYTYGEGGYRVYSQNSQFWLGLGLKNNVKHVHIPSRQFNPIQKIAFTNYSGSQTSCYVAFGEYGTILTSALGLQDTWEPICFERFGYGGPNSLENVDPIQIVSWSSSWATGSIRDALAIPYHNSGKDGCHYQWALIVENASNSNRPGKLVRTKLELHGNSSYKIPTKDQWEYVDLDTTFPGIDLHSMAYGNISGIDKSSSEFEPGFIAVGRQVSGILSNGFVGYESFAHAPGLNSLNQWSMSPANDNDNIWLSVTCGKYPDGNIKAWVCGYKEGSPDSGIIMSGTLDGNNIEDQTPNVAGWFAPNPVPILRSIAYNVTSGSVSSYNSGLMCVGDNGTILHSSDGGDNWNLRTPANGYTGSFVEVKKVYELNNLNPFGPSATSIKWIVIGDDGEIQFTTDLSGSNWYSFRTGKPAPGAIISSIQYPNRLYPSASLGRSVGFDPRWKNFSYTSQNSSFRSYYAGSLERTLVTNIANITKPLYTIGAGGVSIHDFNKQVNGVSIASTSTVLTCRLADVSSSVKFNYFEYGNANGSTRNGFLPELRINSLFIPETPVSRWIKPTNDDFYRAYFGYGDGFSLDLTDWQYGDVLNVGRKGKTVGYLDWSPYDVYNHIDIPQFNLYGPQLRGWKYGLYSGINTPTSAVWRRGRYGQFRDMLEQRIFTKYILIEQPDPYSYPRKGIKRTVDGPVKVNFVSGSAIYADTIDYVTATNPSYNPYDSGIYDTEYRSGQPFFDRPNED